MTISINKDACIKNNISLEEVLLLLVIKSGTKNKEKLQECKDLLVKKGYITASYDASWMIDGYRITNKGESIITSVVLDSEKDPQPKETLEELAQALKDIFPKGKKPDTNYYWTEGVAIIVRRLKLFYKKFGNNYSNEQIIKATKKYVEDFNGNYHYMKLLKYFIFKEKVGASGDVEGDSDLLSYIENDGQEGLGNDWNTELI